MSNSRQENLRGCCRLLGYFWIVPGKDQEIPEKKRLFSAEKGLTPTKKI